MSEAPILHIVDATLTALAQQAEQPQRVGIIATQGTLEAGWYQHKLAAQGMAVIEPTAEELASGLSPAVTRSNAARWKKGRAAGAPGQRAVCTRRAKLILACTEVPVALAAVKAPFADLTFDPAQALAERCSQLWQAR